MTIIAPPPPAPPAPPALTPGGRTAVRATLVAVAATLIAGCVASLGVAAWGVSAVRVAADTSNLPVDMQSLTLDTGDVASAVRIVTDPGAQTPSIAMRQLRSGRTTPHDLVVTESAGATRIAVSGDETTSFLPWDRAGELTLTLPPELARRLPVTVVQQDGVLLTQADLAALTVHNTDGAIVLDANARRVELHTVDGRVVTRKPISVDDSFSVQTVDGDVHVEFANAAPRTTDVVSNDGDVSLALPRTGPYLVRASGGSTSVRVPQTTDPAQAVGRITVSAHDGNVTIGRLDAGAGFTSGR